MKRFRLRIHSPLLKYYLRITYLATRMTLRPETTISAAGNAFFAFFSLFPLLLLLMVATTYWFVPPAFLEAEMVSTFRLVAPGSVDWLTSNLQVIVERRTSITGVALLGLVWSSSSVFYFLSRTTDLIFFGGSPRSGLRQRGWAILYVLGIGVVFLMLSVGANVAATILREAQVPEAIWILYRLLSQGLALFLGFFMYLFLYRLLPYQRPPWSEIIPGAIASGLLWEIAKRVFIGYVAGGFSMQGPAYASVTSLVAFLVWVYLSSTIYFFGAHFAAISWRYRQHQHLEEMNILKNLFHVEFQ